MTDDGYVGERWCADERLHKHDRLSEGRSQSTIIQRTVVWFGGKSILLMTRLLLNTRMVL